MHIYVPFDLKVNVYKVEKHCWLWVKDLLKDKEAQSLWRLGLHSEVLSCCLWPSCLPEACSAVTYVGVMGCHPWWIKGQITKFSNCPKLAPSLVAAPQRGKTEQGKVTKFCPDWRQKHHRKVSRWLLQPLFTQHLLFGNKEYVLSTGDNFYDLSCTNKW